MPNCSETNHKCGVACTDANGRGYFKDCKTGRIGSGASYDEARKSSVPRQACAGLTGETLKACQNRKSTLFRNKSKITQPIKNIRKNVPLGSRFDTKENNWKDTEKLLGDPEPDDDPSTVGGFGGNCHGIPMECGQLAVIGGAIVLLILVMKFLH